VTEDRPPRAEPSRRAGEGDVLRGVAEIAPQPPTEADAEGPPDRDGAVRAVAGAAQVPRRAPRPDARHAAGLVLAPRPRAAPGRPLPAVPRAPEGGREGVGGGDPGGVNRWRAHAPGRRAGPGDGLPGVALGRRAAFSPARRHLPEGQGGRPDPLRRPHDRGRDRRRGPAGGPRHGPGSSEAEPFRPAFLEGLPGAASDALAHVPGGRRAMAAAALPPPSLPASGPGARQVWSPAAGRPAPAPPARALGPHGRERARRAGPRRVPGPAPRQAARSRPAGATRRR
jgi:hypothetical protein